MRVIAGGALGAVLGSSIGHGSGSDGKTIAVVQEADEAFNVGDRVRILKGPDGTTRVRH